MTRYRLLIEYDGTGYVGWQRQTNGPSIQQAIEEAIHAFCGESASLVVAGRTDAGVHALGQVAHLDLTREWKNETVVGAINHHLKPARIAILDAQPVKPEFSARFDAVQRTYRYRIICRRARLAVELNRAWHVPRKIDSAAMSEAAPILCGRHDFTTFRDAECQADSPFRTLDALQVEQTGDVIEVTATARSFLHRQVRRMVGSLLHVGEGRWTSQTLRDALAARDRSRCGTNAPPEGLYLLQVRYPED